MSDYTTTDSEIADAYCGSPTCPVCQATYGLAAVIFLDSYRQRRTPRPKPRRPRPPDGGEPMPAPAEAAS